MTNVNDFEAAKSVADLLKGMDSERQARILRWVSESLGLVHAPHHRHESQPTGAMTEQRVLQSGSGATDIKSFVATKEPKSDNQFAATVAYFYRFAAPHNERRDSITSEVLQEATRLSGRSRLGDPGKTLRNAKDMGYLDATDRGEFKINTVGENLVAMTLPGQARAAPGKASRKTPKAKKAKRR